MGREEFDRVVDSVRRGVDAPTHGIHGPGSMSWRVDRESILFLGAGSAALLQAAHPFVAHAVQQHSATRTDPVGRFLRTFQNVHAMVFGSLGDATESAARVRAIHDRIRGRIAEDVGAFERGAPYLAHDAKALLWVHATLIETSMQIYGACVESLDDEERDRYWQGSKRFARLFGIPDDVLPGDWGDFRRYWEETVASDEIAVGAPARELAFFLLGGDEPSLGMRWYRRFTSGLLPPKLRAPFGLPDSPRDLRVYERSLRVLRQVYPRLPSRLRHIPAYVEAQRRLDGRGGPDRFGRALERLILERIRP